MSIFNFRDKDLSKVSRGSAVVGTVVVVLALVAAFVGWNLQEGRHHHSRRILRGRAGGVPR